MEDAEASQAIEGDHLFRILSGYDRVPRYLREGAHSARLLLNTVVTTLRWRRGEVETEARTASGQPVETVTARRALVTVPIGVLQAPPGAPGAIRFDPEPPNLKAARRLEMGDVMRLTLRFHEAFWERREGLSEMAFLHALDEWVPAWWTALPVRAPILTAWAGGPPAERYTGRGESFAVEQALSALARVLGMPRGEIEAQVEGWHWHDWRADPYSRGAYSYAPPGGAALRRTLAAPAGDTLFFAGEATDTEGHSAMVHGAIATGRRAAAEILASLGQADA